MKTRVAYRKAVSPLRSPTEGVGVQKSRSSFWSAPAKRSGDGAFGVVKECAQNGRTSGFTLIELVISAAVMSIILAGAYLCLHSGMSSERLVESRAELVQTARIALALMSADLRSACPQFKGPPFLGMNRLLDEVEADNLDFATRNYAPKREGEGDFCEVSYFLLKDPASGEFSLWRRRDTTPDDDPLSGGTREEIARGLRGVQFEYYDGFEWFDEWGDAEGRGLAENSQRYRPNLYGMPEAVRITLWVDPAAHIGPAKDVENPEPPLVFQTVARLNMAALGRETGESGATEGETPANPAEAAPRPGGNQ